MTLRTEDLPHGRPGGSPAFEDECRQALQELRVALIEAFAAAGVDVSSPRKAARQLELDKSLAWRVSKFIGQPDVFREVGNLPHRAGMGILGRALENAGAAAATVERLQRAHEALDALVVRHAGDRETFGLVARGLGDPASRAAALEHDRKLAFRGASALWSAQARVQLAVAILMPNADDATMVDVVHLFGLVDLLRLRNDVRWTLSHQQVFDDAVGAVDGVDVRPLAPEGPQGGLGLLHEFSSDPFPDLIVEELDGERTCSLPEGRVGRTAQLTAVFGQVYTALGSCYASEGDIFSQMVAKLRTPAEHLHFDMLVHEDLKWAMRPSSALFGALDGRGYHMGCGREGLSLPFSETVIHLGSGLAGTATQRMPWYSSLLEWAFSRLGTDPGHFRAFRFEMAYPPVPADAILYSKLLPPAD